MPDDKINIIGAAGPMGTMHVIRDICQGVPGVTVFAGDLSDERLAMLRDRPQPLAREEQASTLHAYNPSKERLAEEFDYIVLMAPVPRSGRGGAPAAPRGIINIFAGHRRRHSPPSWTSTPTSRSSCYFIGTSGSMLDDMKLVLAKVAARQLDTNLSVAAVSGLDGAIDGIRAVEKTSCPARSSSIRPAVA